VVYYACKRSAFFWHWNNFSEIGPKEINKNASTAVPLNVCVKKKQMEFCKNIKDELDTDLPRELKVPSAISTSKKYKSKTEN